MTLSPADFVSFLNGVPPELLLVAQMLFCFAAVLAMARAFGATGVQLYIALAVIAANIEVLKPVKFAFYDHPVAMGTILFSSTYLATDILTEHYGREAARRGIFMGFAAYLLFTLLVLLTLGFRPMSAEQAGDDMAWALPMQAHLSALFLPAPSLFLAGMVAYLTSQLCDVWIYQRIRGITGQPHLWLRNNGSTMISALIDNSVFSVLAWVVLAEHPIGWHALVFTYILGTYLMRVAASLLDTPFLYLSRLALRPHLAQRGSAQPAGA